MPMRAEPVEAPQLLGSFTASGREITVHRHGEHALWLNAVDSQGRPRQLGTVRWDACVTPSLQFAPGQAYWVMPHSKLAMDIVDKAMAVYRLAVAEGQPPAHIPEIAPQAGPRPSRPR
ncbi:MAG: hypothetical protein ACRDXX_13715 [Stackebrandtia sp.]